MASYETADTSECVAIIGMSGRFPGATNVTEFWANLKSGRECVRFFSNEQLLELGVEASLLKQPNFVSALGVLDNIEYFDASFFGYTASEAEIIDPEHRLFLECAWEALEHAGLNPERHNGRIGVYAGAGLLPSYIHQLNNHRDLLRSRFYSVITGNDKDHLAPRVAYKLNLRGPAITVQTACSTSLVAVHLACQSLLSGECDIALSGGASIRLRPGYLFEEGGILSSDGHCRAFDAQAAGTVPGSGVAVVVLKRLADAVQDRDTVYAIVRGSAINNDGSAKVGYTAPGIDGQAAVIAEAMAVAGVTADTVSYVEAHGTGTALGDPIEVSALTKAYRAHTDKKAFCALGSVKTNIGHLDAAAGVTGLIKTALSLHHNAIPPSLHFRSPNPQLELPDSPFYVNSELREWNSHSAPRRAGVSSFGIGGTNAHVIVEEAPAVEPSGASRRAKLLLFSAKSLPALEELTDNFEQYLSESPTTNLADVAYTLQVGRKAFPHRRMLVCREAAEAVNILKTRAASRLFSAEPVSGHHPVALAFPGQGAQYVNMGRELYQTEAIFRRWIDTCAEILKPHAGFDVRDLLYPEERNPNTAQQLTQTAITQAALFTLEYSLTQLWMAWGIRPDALIGHSLGEYVAACIAGVFPLEHALPLIAARGRLMENISAGAMLAVPLSASEARQFTGKALSIAAINGPSRCVISGPESAIAELEFTLGEKGLIHRRLSTSRPFHSSMVEPILEPFRECLRKVRFNPPQIPFVSNLTGTWITEDEATDPEYWVRHLREPVNFDACLSELLKEPNRVLIEMGPGSTLCTLAQRHPAKRPHQTFISSLGSSPEQDGSDETHLLTAVGKLWLAGLDIDWQEFYANEERRHIPLPTYPFQRQRYWIGAPSPAGSKEDKAVVTRAQVEPSMTFERQLRAADQLKEIFSGFFGVKSSEIPNHSTFLEMGGDSLMLLQASQEIKRKTGVKIPFRKMLDEVSTIEKLAEYVCAMIPADQLAMDQMPAQTSPVNAIAEQAIVSEINQEHARTSARDVSRPSSDTTSPVANDLLTPTSVNGRDRSHMELPNGSAFSGNLHEILAQQLQAMSSLVSEQLDLLKHIGLTPAADAANGSANRSDSNGNARSEVESNGANAPKPSCAIAKASGEGLDSRQRKHLEGLIERFSLRTAQSKRIAEQYRPVVADDRATTGFHPLWKEMQYSLIAQRASGSRLWDIDNNEYVDITMGFGALLFGHSPSFVVEALRAQAQNGIQLGWESLMSRKAAELICELTGVERVAFCNSGTEAVMSALRLARAFTGREKIALFEGAYHGTFDQVLVRKTPDGSSRAMPLAPGVPRHITDSVILLDPNKPESLDILRERGHELAAVLVEPMQRARPDRDSGNFLKELRRITEQSGSALILDEVITGFRFHPGGAQALFDVRADLVTYGKSIGGGVPVAVVAGKAAFMDAIDGGMWRFGDRSLPEADSTFFAGTFFKHPLIMAPVAAVLEHVKASGPKLQEDLNNMTARLARKLNDSFAARDLPVQVMHRGSFFRFLFPPELKWTELFYFHLLAKGLYVCETRNCFLSTAHTTEDVDYVVRAATEAAEEMRDGGFFPDPSSTRIEPSHSGTAAQNGTGASTLRTIPLTETEKQVWALAQMGDGASGACNESFRIDFRGPLRVSTLRNAIEKLADRHEALRTTITPDGAHHCIHPRMKFVIEENDLRALDQPGKEERLKSWLAEQATGALDFERGPLFRVGLAILSDQHHVLALTFSHLISDARSNGILITELAALYTAECQGSHCALPETVQLDAPSDELNEQFGSDEQMRTDEEYWVNQFTGADPIVNLPTDRPRPSQHTFSVARQSLTIDASLAKQLRQPGPTGSTLFMTLLSTFSVLVHALSRSNDIAIGINLASELGQGRQDSVGFSINPFALRFKITDQTSFTDHLANTKQLVLDAYEHRSYSIGKLIKKLNLWSHQTHRLPFSSVVFNLDKPLTGIAFFALDTVISSNPTGAKVDMEWNVIDTNEDLLIDCDYNSDLFDQTTIQRWLHHFQALLQAIASDSAQPVSALVELVARKEDASLGQVRKNADIYTASNLTPMQTLFWIGQKVQPETPVYNRPCRFIISGPVDRLHFQKAFRALLDSSDALRTVITEVNGVPQKTVLPSMDYEPEYVDFSHASDPEAALNNWVAKQSRVNFDLETRLFDSALLKLNDQKYVHYVNCHNVIADGLSAFLIYGATAEAYGRSLAGKSKLLTLPPVHEYEEFERQHRSSARYPKSELYWKQKLNPPPPPLTFYGRAASGKRSGAVRVTHRLDSHTANSLRALANTKGIFVATEDLSLFSVFATILMTYLYQVSSNRDLSLSVTYHNRITKSFSNTIGVLMQVLPLRLTLLENETFRSVSRRLSGEILNGLKHLPYSITDGSDYRKGQVLLNYITSTWPKFGDAPVEFHWDHSGHQDELLVVQPHRIDTEGNLAIEFDFDQDLFDERMRQQAIGDFLRITDAFIADADQALDSPDILWSSAHKQKKSSLENEVVFDLDF